MTHQEKQEKANASSWRYSLPVILKSMVDTINILKNKKVFSEDDLSLLRRLYSEVTKLSEKNKESNISDTSNEMKLTQQMLDVINKYSDQTKIYAGVQKTITRAMMGSPVSVVVSYYYRVGKDQSFSLLKVN
jgi:hypothetical protein